MRHIGVTRQNNAKKLRRTSNTALYEPGFASMPQFSSVGMHTGLPFLIISLSENLELAEPNKIESRTRDRALGFTPITSSGPAFLGVRSREKRNYIAPNGASNIPLV